ncbi:acetyl-CoA hydrolase/transferase C-terminal domain-containing protein [Pelomonas sp. SE-A7]|uniref:acetyl-CoA hydrolase/transferase C-terminal domain-containing protein n=1 Tax=Pelomonas sp. SE-A7 TaxID=3054953 RepID=UPI00259C874C|nr:acetyl-CoA hydrolase/transferase C-terminal domain-containing protein [Pelomonas sp. SE-A7]MDM4766627.1 acetyl-CoA hydrolase/transferase C-terminal domain-containing protein [Pelomonas sp. SE-A7]
MTKKTQSIEAAVEAVLQAIPGDLVMAIPLGIGKPNAFVNALYRRIAAEPSRRLAIFTALSLEKPVGHSELEEHFLAPLRERVFADYPDLDYVKALRGPGLPPNIAVHEFFMKTGDYLGNDAAQQGFVCTNYSFVVRDMMAQGVNLIAQAVAERDGLLSLSSNPDLTLDLIERMGAAGRPLMTVAAINRQLPFMVGEAALAPERFDIVIDEPACSHTLFAPPNAAIGWADHAIGLHASSLVVDGGTLQIGIGSLGDAIANALIVRDRHNESYRRMLTGLAGGDLQGRELEPFAQGLYGCSEMFVNGFMRLIDAGIVRRRVFMDATLQSLSDQGRLGPRPGANVLRLLLERGRIAWPLREDDIAYLERFGVLRVGARPTTLDDDSAIGERWREAPLMHGGFFLGPGDFYQRLRDLREPLREQISMTRISFVNELWGDRFADESLKRAQRRQARLMNTTMKMTLLGAASSDGLASGQMVSGVGGQYNFVAMAHALPDARLVLLMRATHDNAHGLTSSIVWDYANCTIPRHLRDLVITEYGVADLRGQTDAEVVKRLLNVTDSRFQESLREQAVAHGKLEPDYRIPERFRSNSPEMLREQLRPWRNAGLLADFPFGTDLDEDELKIVRALKKLKHASAHPAELLPMVFQSLTGERPVPEAYLERLGLDQAQGFKQLFLRRLFSVNL